MRIGSFSLLAMGIDSLSLLVVGILLSLSLAMTMGSLSLIGMVIDSLFLLATAIDSLSLLAMTIDSLLFVGICSLSLSLGGGDLLFLFLSLSMGKGYLPLPLPGPWTLVRSIRLSLGDSHFFLSVSHKHLLFFSSCHCLLFSIFFSPLTTPGCSLLFPQKKHLLSLPYLPSFSFLCYLNLSTSVSVPFLAAMTCINLS